MRGAATIRSTLSLLRIRWRQGDYTCSLNCGLDIHHPQPAGHRASIALPCRECRYDRSGTGALLIIQPNVGRLPMWLVPILIAALVGCGDDASTGVNSTATPELATRQAPVNPPAPQSTVPLTVTPDAAPTPVTTPDPTTQPTVAPTQPPAKQPSSPDTATDSEVAGLVAANSEFAMDLYRAVADADSNAIISPHSISLALAMTYAGAAGETRIQMDEVLGFRSLQERVHPVFHSLQSHLDSRAGAPTGGESKGFKLNIANAVWGQQGREFLSLFVSTVQQSYGAGLMEVDFAGAPESSRIRINDWVGDQTEGRITDLIAPGVVNSATRLVLANAVYFKAAWHLPFDEDATSPLPFRLLDGWEINVPMMRQVGKFGFDLGDGLQTVELLYEGREMSMIIFLPDEGRFEELKHLWTSGSSTRWWPVWRCARYG